MLARRGLHALFAKRKRPRPLQFGESDNSGVQRSPDVEDKRERARCARDRSGDKRDLTSYSIRWAEKETGHHECKTRICHPQMKYGHPFPAQRTTTKSGQKMVANTEDHHRDESEKIHVHVSRAIDDEFGRCRHRDAEQHSTSKPRKARLDEVPDESIHQTVAPWPMSAFLSR